VEDIANLVSIDINGTNLHGGLFLDTNTSHVSKTYILPVKAGTDYSIRAYYDDGSVMYYDSSTSQWSSIVTNSNVAISTDIVLPSVPDLDALYGTKLSISDNLDDSEVIAIGFDFKFFDTLYTDLTISTHGHIQLGSNTGTDIYNHAWNWDVYNDGIPIISPFWTDLDPLIHGSIYYKLITENGVQKIVISYILVDHFNQNNHYSTFRVILDENNNITYEYDDIDFNEANFDSDGGTEERILGGRLLRKLPLPISRLNVLTDEFINFLKLLLPSFA